MGGGAVSRHPGHTPTHAPAPPKRLQLLHHLRMLLWNPHVSPGGPPRPAPVGSRPRASSDAGTWTLLPGLRLGAELETRWGSPLLRRRCPLRGCVVPALVPAVAREGCAPRGGRGAEREAGRRGEGAPACLHSRSPSWSPAFYFTLPSTSIHASTGSFIS